MPLDREFLLDLAQLIGEQVLHCKPFGNKKTPLHSYNSSGCSEPAASRMPQVPVGMGRSRERDRRIHKGRILR